MKLIINTDGGGQAGTDVGGAAACGYVVQTDDGTYLGSRSECLTGTNNDAEYTGVLLALRDLIAGESIEIDKIESIEFIGDSQLVIYQITGAYRCKLPHLAAHRDNVHALLRKLPFPVTFTWKRREHNTEADVLCAAAMEHGPKLDFFAPLPADPRKKKGIESGPNRKSRVYQRVAFAVEPIDTCELRV